MNLRIKENHEAEHDEESYRYCRITSDNPLLLGFRWWMLSSRTVISQRSGLFWAIRATDTGTQPAELQHSGGDDVDVEANARCVFDAPSYGHQVCELGCLN
ncbi:hypothetical protein SeMB42_g02289 [Synchytrium endobioticum]|uniref:Uncharacterized protein n=1 Tax=Synchytrium endobioticum TaxID=286115 RepID=A0A507DFG8_9FUNG|nr:hypothetical protein SeMB42_g02289 [Synchytrium endobioticum]